MLTRMHFSRTLQMTSERSHTEPSQIIHTGNTIWQQVHISCDLDFLSFSKALSKAARTRAFRMGERTMTTKRPFGRRPHDRLPSVVCTSPKGVRP